MTDDRRRCGRHGQAAVLQQDPDRVSKCLVTGIQAEQPSGPGSGPLEPEQNPQGRCLAGTVGTEQYARCPRLDLEIEAVHGSVSAKSDFEALDIDCAHDAIVGRRDVTAPRCRTTLSTRPVSLSRFVDGGRAQLPRQ